MYFSRRSDPVAPNKLGINGKHTPSNKRSGRHTHSHTHTHTSGKGIHHTDSLLSRQTNLNYGGKDLTRLMNKGCVVCDPEYVLVIFAYLVCDLSNYQDEGCPNDADMNGKVVRPFQGFTGS